MNNRASLQLSAGRNRAPPKQTQRAPQPASIEITSSTHAREEIERAIAEMKELDRTMRQIDQDIEERTNNPTTDEWDLIAIDRDLDQLSDQRSKASFSLLFAANRVAYFGAYLVGEWREVDLDNIARQLSQTDGLFGRLRVEWPGVLEHQVWQRIYGEAAPF